MSGIGLYLGSCLIAWLLLTTVMFREEIARLLDRIQGKEDDKLAPEDVAWHLVEQSLIRAPDEWEADNYYATNAKRSLSVWVANQDYGLSVGNLTRETEVRPPKRWQARIWTAYQVLYANKLMQRFKDAA